MAYSIIDTRAERAWKSWFSEIPIGHVRVLSSFCVAAPPHQSETPYFSRLSPGLTLLELVPSQKKYGSRPSRGEPHRSFNRMVRQSNTPSQGLDCADALLGMDKERGTLQQFLN